MRHSARGMLAIAGISMAVAGCSSGSARRYHNPEMDFSAIRTIAIVPLQNLSRDQLAADRVRDVLANMLLATGEFYVVPHGEVLRVLRRAGVANPSAPSNDEVVKLGKELGANAILVGVVKEYGEVRSGAHAANVVSLGAQLQEVETGRIVWSGSSTKGGVTFGQRLFGGGGQPLELVTQEAVDDLLDQLFE